MNAWARRYAPLPTLRLLRRVIQPIPRHHVGWTERSEAHADTDES
jgi:hypothetical protein